MAATLIAGLPIEKVSKKTTHVNMLVYGESGVGKTRLAGSSDAVPSMRRVLLIDVEGGTLTLRSTYPDVETVRVRSWNEIRAVYDELYLNPTYNTIIIDSLTELQKMCYSSDTEVLTPSGWKAISSLSENIDLIAQYEIGTELISFVLPTAVMNYHHHGDMINIPCKSSALLVTPNHRVLTNTQNGNYLKIRRADEIKSGSRLKLPTSGTLLSVGGPSPEQGRLLTAWAADGHRNFNGMKFHLKKESKIERIKKLIVECGLTYHEPKWKDDGHYIIVTDASSVTKFMPDRMWKPEHMFWSLQTRDAIMAELPYWDSQIRYSKDGEPTGSFTYHTSYESNADAILALAVVTGWSASKYQTRSDTDEQYNVNLVRSSWRASNEVKSLPYNGKVWCVSVPSGFIVTRRDGKVTICGNSMDQIMRRLVEEHEERDADVPGIREWNINLEQTRKFVRAFRDLPVNTIFTALAKSDKNMRTGAVRRKPSLSGKVADEVAGFLDIVVYLYAKEVEGENKRVLQCGQTEETVAKDRTNNLPLTILEPTMDKIWSILHKESDGPEGQPQ